MEAIDVRGSDYVKTVKIAMAMAIIRCKPVGSSGEQYATRLVSEFQASQLRWKERSSVLQQELLAVRQQLLLSKLPPSQPDTEPDLLPDGQNFSEDSASFFPTPPASLEEQNNQRLQSLECRLNQHVNFLQSVISLQSITRSQGHLSGSEKDVHELTQDTLCNALESIQESVTDASSVIPHSCLLHAVRVIIAVIQGDVIKHHADVILSKTAEMLQKLVMTIINDNDINTVERQEKWSELLIEFGRCPRLKHGVLKLLSRCVLDYSDILRRCCTRREQIHPHTFENMFFIISSFERLLQAELEDSHVDVPSLGDSQMHSAANVPSASRRQQDSLQCLPLEVIAGLESEMEQSLLHITQRFPLFTHALWHIGALLQLIKQQLN